MSHKQCLSWPEKCTSVSPWMTEYMKEYTYDKSAAAAGGASPGGAAAAAAATKVRRSYLTGAMRVPTEAGGIRRGLRVLVPMLVPTAITRPTVNLLLLRAYV